MEFIRTLAKDFDVGEEAELSIDNRSGSVTVRGDDTQRVRVEVVARLWGDSEDEADDQAELIARGIRHEGKRVTIRAPSLLRPGPFLFFARSPRLEYQVTVPRATKAIIASHSGRVDVDDLARPLQVEVRSGRVAVRDIGGDTRIASSSGRVQAESIAGSLAVDCRSGSVRVSRCEGDVSVHSRSGAIQVEDVGRGLKVEARSGAVRYEGDVRGPFEISVTSGSVRLVVSAESRFLLDAETRSGAIHSDLPVRSMPAGTAPSRQAGPTVRVRTVSGSIHIARR